MDKKDDIKEYLKQAKEQHEKVKNWINTQEGRQQFKRNTELYYAAQAPEPIRQQKQLEALGRWVINKCLGLNQ